jgi:hypothetical protein
MVDDDIDEPRKPILRIQITPLSPLASRSLSTMPPLKAAA